MRLLEDEEEEQLNTISTKTRIRAAIDSGACRNCTHPKTLPAGVKITPNVSGKHFSGAGGEVVEKFGECLTTLTSPLGEVGCRWNLADVSRPLHSVSQIAGPEEGDGEHDVLFNNKMCVVVQPGIVAALLKHIKPIAQYDRDGNLYLSEFDVSDFIRPGQDQ